MAGNHRPHRWFSVVLSALLLGIAVSVAVPLWTGGRLASEAAPPAHPEPPPPCPRATPADFTHTNGDRDGLLVPTGVVSAVVCAYEVLDVASLRGSRPLDGGPLVQAVTLLNELPPKLPGSSMETACLAMGREEHRVVFGYRTGRAPVIVDISLNCGTAHHNGAVRYLHNAKPLLKLLHILR